MSKTLYSIIAVLIVCIVALSYFIFTMSDSPNTTNTTLEDDVTPIPGGTYESLPTEEALSYYDVEFEIEGETRVRTTGTIEEIVEPESIYRMRLADGSIIDGVVTSGILIADARFKMQGGYVVNTDFHTLPMSDLSPRLNKGNRMIVQYKKNELVSDAQEIDLYEFVLLD